MKYIKDEDLEFLQFVSSKDLNGLVKILTKPITEELTSRDIYKEFNPKHDYYWQEIAAELQYYGGNTINNTIRRNGVKYVEILRDVCKALKIDIEYPELMWKESILEKMATKVSKLVGVLDYFKSIEELENELLSNLVDKDDALKKASPKISLKNKDVLIATIAISAFLLKRISDPNFKVTAKAIFEIAQLRKNHKRTSKQLVIENVKEKKPPIQYKESLLIKDSDNVELGQLKIIDDASIENVDFVRSNDIEIDKIKQFVTDAIKSTISLPNQTVELVFSPEVQKKLATGIYRQIDGRAIARDTNGKIKGHAKIISSGQGKQLLVGGYQLLSIAVAQSHLAEIEKSLSEIKNLISQIQEKLEAEDKSQINGAIEYITGAIDFIRKNNYNTELSPIIKQQIGNITLDVIKWKNKLLEEFENLNKQIDNQSNKDIFGTKNTYNEIKKLLINIEPLKVRYALILKLTLMLTLIKKLIDPNEQEFLIINIQLDKFKEKMKRYEKSINDKKEIFKSFFNSNDTLEERKKIIDILQNNQKNDFEILTLSYQKQAQDIDKYFNSFKNGKTTVTLSFDENANIDKYAINY